jgi:hypothetical protein
MANNRCWKGYEPVKGKKPYSSGSCKKSSKSKSSTKKAPCKSCQKNQQRGNVKKAKMMLVD